METYAENKNHSVIIEMATEEHIPAIIDVEEKAWLATYPCESFSITKDDVQSRFTPAFKEKRAREIQSEMKNKNHIYKILIKDGRVVGYLHLLKEANFNDFVELYILEEFQGQGYGGLMLRDALAWLDDGKPIQLEVAAYNTNAKKIYEHFGFREDASLSQLPAEDWNVLPSGKRIPVVFMVLN